MLSIENEYLRVECATLGGEMQRIYDKKNREERLWSGDPQYWGKFSPVLFPFVGASKDGQYSYKGKTYPMKRHGFAREMPFKVIKQTCEQLVFSLESNPETLAVYPFSFTLNIHYSLRKSALQITYEIINSDEEDMFFSVGGHPAFHADFKNRQCFIEFEKDEDLFTTKINVETGLLKSAKAPIALIERRLRLTAETFKEDALVFDNIQSEWVRIIDEGFKKSIKVTIKDFPTLGIWSAYGPFLCVEPWQGMADFEDASGKLEEKYGVKRLKGNSTVVLGYEVAVE